MKEILDVDRGDVERGQVIAKPGSVTPHTEFEAEVYVLSKDEGGRHKPFFTGYKPQFYLRTTDVTGEVTLPEGVEMVMPGDNVKVSVKLITPVAMHEGLRFAVREGGHTVGAGVVSKVKSSTVIPLGSSTTGSSPSKKMMFPSSFITIFKSPTPSTLVLEQDRGSIPRMNSPASGTSSPSESAN